MRRIQRYLLALVLSISMATAITVTITTQGTQPYNSSTFDATVNASGPANITLSFNGTEMSESETSNHDFTGIALPGNYEGTQEITVTAVNASNASDNTSKSENVEVDTSPPNVTLITAPDNVTGNGTFSVSASVTEENLAQVWLGNNASFSKNLKMGNSTPSRTTNRSEFGCSLNTNCTLRVQAEDSVGQEGLETTVVYFAENTTDAENTSANQSANSSNVTPVEIDFPENQTTLDNNPVRYRIAVDTSGFALDECRVELRHTQDQLFYDAAGPGVVEHESDDFTGETIKIVEGSFREVKYGSPQDYPLKLRVTCWSASEEHQVVHDFALEDLIGPRVKDTSVLNISDSTATIAVNFSEPTLIDVQYRDESTPKNESIEPATSSNYRLRHEYQLAGLQADTTYLVRINGTDRAGNIFNQNRSNDDGSPRVQGLPYADLSFTTTGDRNPVNQTSLEQQLMSQNASNTTDNGPEPFTGENFSYGIDWLEAGKETSRSIGNFDMNLRELIMKPRVKLRDVKGSVTTTKNPPEWVDSPMNVSVFEYYHIEKNFKFTNNRSDDPLEYVKIRFQVENDWIDDNDIENAYLYRKHDGEWNQLPTSLEEEGALLSTYEAVSPGFSIFAVGGKQARTEQSPTTQTEPENTTSSDEDENEMNTTTDTPGPTGSVTSSTDFTWLRWPAYVAAFILIAYGTFAFLTRVESGRQEDPAVLKEHTKRLESFVDKALQRGVSKHKLRDELIEKGWDERLVDFVLRNK